MLPTYTYTSAMLNKRIKNSNPPLSSNKLYAPPDVLSINLLIKDMMAIITNIPLEVVENIPEMSS